MANLDLFNKKDRSDPNRDDIPVGILRQRRNLLIISFILIAIYFAGLKFQFSSIEAFGITATLQRPEVIENFLFLWVIWGYFLVRYIQYLNFYKSNSEVLEALEPILQSLYTKHLSVQILEKFPECKSPEKVYYVYPRRITHSMRGSYHVESGTTDGHYDERKFVTKLSYVKLWIIKLIAILRLISSHRHFSDYYLPFLVAIVPCIQAIF